MSRAPALRVVLVRPRNPLNIGAAARAMANFGFDDLKVVKPYAPVWRETVSAVGAERLVLEAEAVPALERAVRDCHLVVGTSALRERRLERPLLRLPELAAYLKQRPEVGRVALVFGPEKTGLSNKYLRQCHVLLTVPTSPGCPSMNLGQAVAVCCYELARANRRLGPRRTEAQPAPTFRENKQLMRHALQVFDAAGYLDFLPADQRLEKVRRTLLGWKVRRRDLALLHGIFRFLLRRLK